MAEVVAVVVEVAVAVAVAVAVVVVVVVVEVVGAFVVAVKVGVPRGAHLSISHYHVRTTFPGKACLFHLPSLNPYLLAKRVCFSEKKKDATFYPL